MVAKKLPDVAYLHECFSYDPGTGSLIWKVRPREHFTNPAGWVRFNTHTAGNPAGVVRVRQGGAKFLTVKINCIGYPAHRIVWALVHSSEPDGIIDHRDRDGLNNRSENLRECTHSQNMRNRLGMRLGGLKGACRKLNRWEARICTGEQQLTLGYFDTEAEAHAAYCVAAAKYHGDFARTS